MYMLAIYNNKKFLDDIDKYDEKIWQACNRKPESIL